MADDRDLIRSRIDLVDLVGQRVALKRAGKTWKGLCPFHNDRNPSFTVDSTVGRYKCWSCGASGDCFTWVMETQKLEFVDALKLLAEIAGVTLSRSSAPNPEAKSARVAQLQLMEAAQEFFLGQMKLSSDARGYCDQRGLDVEVREAWGLGYAPDVGSALGSSLQKKGWSLAEAKELFLVDQDGSGGYFDRFRSRLTIPIRDERGAIVAYGGRIIGAGQPKYINSSDTPLFRKSQLLFGLHAAKESIASSGHAVLVEGYMDVIACHRAGVTQAVASLGTALAEEQARLLKRWCRRVVILYDRDEAGQKAAERSADILLAAGLEVSVALPPPGEDPDSLLAQKGAQAVRDVVAEAIDPIAHRLGRLKESLDPNDSAFWDRAVEALALARNPLEIERHLPGLAAIFPNSPDKAGAQAALRRMAAAAKRKLGGPEPAPEEATTARPKRLRLPPFQIGLEGTVMRALFDPDLVQAAWKGVCTPGLFRPGVAAQAAQALLASLPEGPQGDPRAWLNRVEPPEVADMLMDLKERILAKVTASDLDTALRKLEERIQERGLVELKQKATAGDDDLLREISARLKKTRHGDPDPSP